MDNFIIKQVDGDSGLAGNCNYEIFYNSKLIAYYWHDFRGDDHGIHFINGLKEDWPVGRMTDFIKGGGLTPVTLSAAAIEYLSGKII